MSNPRPITSAIKELYRSMDEYHKSHTIDGVWPDHKQEEHVEYLRRRAVAIAAQSEFKMLRDKELRLSQIESNQEGEAA